MIFFNLVIVINKVQTQGERSLSICVKCDATSVFLVLRQSVTIYKKSFAPEKKVFYKTN